MSDINYLGRYSGNKKIEGEFIAPDDADFTKWMLTEGGKNDHYGKFKPTNLLKNVEKNMRYKNSNETIIKMAKNKIEKRRNHCINQEKKLWNYLGVKSHDQLARMWKNGPENNKTNIQNMLNAMSGDTSGGRALRELVGHGMNSITQGKIERDILKEAQHKNPNKMNFNIIEWEIVLDEDIEGEIQGYETKNEDFLTLIDKIESLTTLKGNPIKKGQRDMLDDIFQEIYKKVQEDKNNNLYKLTISTRGKQKNQKFVSWFYYISNNENGKIKYSVNFTELINTIQDEELREQIRKRQNELFKKKERFEPKTDKNKFVEQLEDFLIQLYKYTNPSQSPNDQEKKFLKSVASDFARTFNSNQSVLTLYGKNDQSKQGFLGELADFIRLKLWGEKEGNYTLQILNTGGLLEKTTGQQVNQDTVVGVINKKNDDMVMKFSIQAKNPYSIEDSYETYDKSYPFRGTRKSAKEGLYTWLGVNQEAQQYIEQLVLNLSVNGLDSSIKRDFENLFYFYALDFMRQEWSTIGETSFENEDEIEIVSTLLQEQKGSKAGDTLYYSVGGILVQTSYLLELLLNLLDSIEKNQPNESKKSFSVSLSVPEINRPSNMVEIDENKINEALKNSKMKISLKIQIEEVLKSLEL